MPKLNDLHGRAVNSLDEGERIVFELALNRGYASADILTVNGTVAKYVNVRQECGCK